MNTALRLTSTVLRGLAVVLGVLIVNFFLIRLAPGDPALMLAGDAGSGDAAYVERLRAQLGLSRPLVEQFALYLRDLAHVDFGFSYRNQLPVLQLVLDRLPATLLLMAAAFAVSVVTGVTAGAVAAYGESRGGPWMRRVARAIGALAVIVYATPLFWLSLMSVIVFSVVLGWLPSFGMESVGAGYTGWRRALDVAAHLVLPAATLGLVYGAIYVQLTRAAMLEVIEREFVRTARAKGASERRVMIRHVLRNALLPVVTLGGLQLGQLAGGALVTEIVFAWPGLGGLMYDALLQRDYPVLLGLLAVVAALVVLFNALTDLLYGIVDPRIDWRGAR
ncbi:MAG: ABC transporter permease [Burkholderia contaminans]|uniref:ABC transporter permease n=1 Tax=Burkholderia contaminans TaxID=488447 RepID=A0AAP4QXR5_9BURK|nr:MULTISPECIES: ABC transporter permease [Burkholderia]MBD1409997.1 ABC transporter permease [Burkholderia contaminans]MBH9668337.1 ABC transporter permease [Burkholderia contaminans]MBH9675381.1 ABC transporter permease [Burkholderia contaminans]MBH9705805.1 ABC transporter permease [Burkholderia contaminans]MBM6425508.1 ABC transporter permease [Burkholderia contaminans]